MVDISIFPVVKYRKNVAKHALILLRVKGIGAFFHSFHSTGGGVYLDSIRNRASTMVDVTFEAAIRGTEKPVAAGARSWRASVFGACMVAAVRPF